jgi:hypothetical protein
MSEMVERVARAICSSTGRDPDSPFRDHHGRPLDFPEWKRWSAEARAAIEAMRETTPEMRQAGVLGAGAHYIIGDPNRVWGAMIDAALATNSPSDAK